MVTLQPRQMPSFARPASPGLSMLTLQEWSLVLKALRAYQHNAQFRPLYERLEATLGNQCGRLDN